MTSHDNPQSANSANAEDASALSIVPFSRRTLFSMTAAVGALTFLGSFLGGRGLAFADEDGAKQFVIYALSREEVPVMALDVSTSDPTAISGMSVTITSLFNGKSLTVKTDDRGFAPANVRALSRQSDDNSARVYNFWASIEAACDGYRAFAEGLHYVEAGTPADIEGNRTNTLQIPSQKLTSPVTPYLRAFTLDGCDIQYARNLEAKVWDGNDMEHELVAEVVTPDAGQTVDISVLVNDVARASTSIASSATAPHSARAVFNRQWLREIPVGATLAVSFSATSSGARQTWTYKSTLTFGEPMYFDGEGGSFKKNVLVSPGAQPSSKPTETFCPIPGFLNRAGDSMCISLPFVPIQIFADLYGRFGITATLESIDFLKRVDGEDVIKAGEFEKSFRGLNREATMKNYKAQNKLIMDGVKSHLAEMAPGSFCGGAFVTSTITANFVLNAMGIGTWTKVVSPTESYNFFTADIALSPTFSVAHSRTVQFWAANIPLFIGYDISFILNCELGFGAQFKDGFKDFGAHYRKNNNPDMNLVIYMRAEVGISVGVGIAGLFSVAIRGYGYLHGIFMFQEADSSKSYPHNIIQIAAGVHVVIQIFFIAKTYRVTETPPKTLYNNWNKNSINDEVLNFDEVPKLDFDENDVVHDDNLFAVVEAQGKWDSANDADDARVPSYELVTPLAANIDMPPRVANLFEDQLGGSRSAVNGFVPLTQTLLYQDCYSNPRMRIIHTSSDSFKHDRAFMVRVLVAEIEAPTSTNAFSTDSWVFDGVEYANGTELGIDVVDGDYFLKPAAKVQTSANATTLPRTRIAVSEWDNNKHSWGETHIVDFTVPGEIYEADRLNSHDIDFDVDFHNGKLLIAITSLQRREGKYDLKDFESRQYLSVVHYDIDKQKVVTGGSTYSLINTGVSLFHPRILLQSFDAAGDRKPTEHCVVYCYACYYTPSGDRSQAYLAATVFDDMEIKSGQGAFIGHRISNPTRLDCSAFEDLDADTLTSGTFEVSCPDRARTLWDDASQRYQSTVMIAWSRCAGGILLKDTSLVFLQTYSVVIKRSGSTTTSEAFVNEKSSLQLSGIPYVAKLSRANQLAQLCYPDVSKSTGQKPLNLITVDTTDFTLGRMENVGLTDKTRYFSSFNGRRLYCVRTMKGTAPATPEDAVKVAQSGGKISDSDGPFNSPNKNLQTTEKEVKLYQLCEARWVGDADTGSYYDFYPIAQVDYTPDNIGVIAANASYTHFTFAQLTEVEQGGTKHYKTDIYQVDVPVVLSARLANVNPSSPFAAAGDTCWYTCEITNVGNAPITAITMLIQTVKDNVKIDVDKTTYADLAKYALASPDDVKQQRNENDELIVSDEGIIEAIEERDTLTAAGILWPGRRRRFKFKFTMPSGYHGNVTFEAAITKVEDRMEEERFAEFALSDTSENGAVPFMVPDSYIDESPIDMAAPILSTYPEEMQIEAMGDTSMDEVYVGTADYTQTEGKPDTPESETGGSSTGTAKTGDNLALLAAAVAAGTAGVAAKKLHDRKEAEEE